MIEPPNGQVLRLEAHGKSFEMWTWPGKIRRALEAGVPYERELCEHIYAEGFRGLAVDAGANIGNHTLWFAAICGLRVAAFEPLYPGILEHNVERNRLQERVKVHGCALGAGPAVAEHLGKGRFRVDITGKYDVQPLDWSQLVDVCLIKADVEGMEAELLQGAADTIQCWRPVIFAEEWGPEQHDRIARVLDPWGYRMTRTFQSGGATAVGRWDP